MYEGDGEEGGHNEMRTGEHVENSRTKNAERNVAALKGFERVRRTRWAGRSGAGPSDESPTRERERTDRRNEVAISSLMYGMNGGGFRL